jgi:acyl-coenzyme A synthetase/AMP-(fatty) acid ligase
VGGSRAGLKVQPAELDILLESHPSVAEACAFAVNDPVSGEAVAAAVRLEPGAAENAESLRAWRRQRMRREAVPNAGLSWRKSRVPCGARSTATPCGVN